MPFPWLLGQDLTIDPTKVAEDLAKAESVQQVLSVVVSVLLVFLLAVVIYHVKRERHHETERKAEVEASNDREDTLREHYETRLDKERVENKTVMRELNDTLRGLAEE